MAVPHPQFSTLRPIADLATGLRHVFVRDLVLEAEIGVRSHEKGRRQRVRINLDLGVLDTDAQDRIENVVCYDGITAGVRCVVEADEHVHLIETLAERIAEVCLRDPRVRIARVRVEKLDVYPDAASVGVEIERRRDG